MNEKEIERLLKAYGDSVPPCTVPALQRKPLRWPRFAAAGIAAAAVAGIAVIGLWPHNAVAESVARLHQALSNAKTMEYTVFRKIPSGWHPVLRATYFEDGTQRYDAQLGMNIEHTAIEQGGTELVDYKILDHASLDVAPSDPQLDKWQTALDIAKRGIDTGNPEIKRSLKIRDHEPVDGKPAYEITMERPSDHYLAKILVDKQTDLPIESSVVVDDGRPEFSDFPNQIRTEFKFNQPLDRQALDQYLKSRKVIRMKDARAQIKEMWRTPLGTVAGSEIRAATVTADGTIWLATTVSGDHPNLPTVIEGTTGRRYVRGGDVSPGIAFDNKAFDAIFGKPIYVTAFAPLPETDPIPVGSGGSNAPKALAPWNGKVLITSIAQGTSSRIQVVRNSGMVTVQFEQRDPSYYSVGRLLLGKVGASELITVPLTYEDGKLPSYFPLLGLDRPDASLAQSIWGAKARELEQSHEYRLAAEAYGGLAKVKYDWVKYSAYQPMLDEARCYRLIGQSEKADQLTQEAAVLRASRER